MFRGSLTSFSIFIVLSYWKTVNSERERCHSWWHLGCIQVLRTRAISCNIHELVNVPVIRESLFVLPHVFMMGEMWGRGELPWLTGSLSFVSRGWRGAIWWVSLGERAWYSPFFLFLCFSGSLPLLSVCLTLPQQCILFCLWPEVCICSAPGTRETDKPFKFKGEEVSTLSVITLKLRPPI